jgi:hypothetical protein
MKDDEDQKIVNTIISTLSWILENSPSRAEIITIIDKIEENQNKYWLSYYSVLNLR